VPLAAPLASVGTTATAAKDATAAARTFALLERRGEKLFIGLRFLSGTQNEACFGRRFSEAPLSEHQAVVVDAGGDLTSVPGRIEAEIRALLTTW
jgi:hypothetical protein